MYAVTYVRVQSIFSEVSVVYEVTHYGLGSVADLLAPTISQPSIHVRPGHRQHFPCASLLRWVAHFMKEPAPQLVPPDWRPPVLPSVFPFIVALLGVVLLCRQSYWLFLPVVRTVSLCRLQASRLALKALKAW